MKVPAKPPAWQDIIRAMTAESGTPEVLAALSQPVDDSEYLPWDRLRYKTPPAGLTHERWWASIKLQRRFNRRFVTLQDLAQNPFHYALTDTLLRRCEDITRRASGQISLPELVTSKSERDRYVVNSLIEEAITSSQLEGASTSRRVAKQMIRSGRPPSTLGEKMILNNYRAMVRVSELRDTPLTPDLVREIHRIVTDGTLEDPRDAGRLQSSDEERIAVWGDGDQLLYRPPSAAELASRLELLCSFANGTDTSSAYIPPPVRAVIVHFMLGYDHYFVDGNGRTARALFYWCMLKQGFWLIEFITISNILKNAPTQYASSFLLTEDDDGDLTHFLLYHTSILERALDSLMEYLARKARELRSVKMSLATTPGTYNHRQLALLERAIHDPTAEFTVASHSLSHAVSGETARQDLADLEQRRLLSKAKRGRAFAWHPVQDLPSQLS